MKKNEPHFIKAKVLGISRQKLRYWRKIGLFTPSHFTTKGHTRYTYEDLKALKTIKLLRESGVSVRSIKVCVCNIKEKIPSLTNPLTQIQLLVVGERIVFIHNKKIYDARSMQGYLVDFIKVKEWAGQLVKIDDYLLSSHNDDADFFIEAKVKSV